ncbi:hypothetical protein BC833DRAFT_624912 [Globomyces pollinis-pini]|nr:hypothetical protein BC833DRAFT_624912 [Globomyces pollinis-pini]
MFTPIYYDPVKFTPLNTVFISISAIIFNLGFISTSIIIYIFFKNYHSSTSCYEKCICFLLFCQWFWAFPYAIQYPYMLSKGESFGFEGCQWMGPVLPLVSGMTIFAHAILAIDRYFTIILQKSMKPIHFVTLSLMFIPAFLFIAICPYFMGTGFALNDGHFCYYNFKSRNIGDLVPIFLILITFFAIFGIITYCYIKIYLVISAEKRISQVKKNSTRDRLNRKIFFTCVAVVGCFTGCYTPIITTFVAQLLFKYEFPEIILHLSTTISISDCLLTPICLFVLVPSYQQGFRKHVYNYRQSEISSITEKPKTTERAIISGI